MKKYTDVKDLKHDYPHLVHASNIVAKLNSKSLKQHQAKAIQDIEETYLEYINSQLNLKGFDDEILMQRVKLLNNYYNFMFEQDYDNLFTSQSKFRPTILEEFMYLLFRDMVESLRIKIKGETKDLILGGVKAYTNLYFKSQDLESFVKNLHTGINVKDQDFAIYRELSLAINGMEEQVVNLPIISIECKTYLDKTMLEGAIATAEKIKMGNPHSKFYVITEHYDVDLQVDPAYSRIDQIYVLRKSKSKTTPRNDIHFDVVKNIVEDVYLFLESKWGDIEAKMSRNGIII